MSLADKSLNPITSDVLGTLNLEKDEPKFYFGITYKQWLVGMLASNPESFLNSRRDNSMPAEGIANYLLDLVDAIIQELEKQ